ncbi:hypothetical protein ONZ45_g5642 [Pleurotus djamor]|nr:hypothetical protein ONZ45_g5642 [Pleurotus djamor]
MSIVMSPADCESDDSPNETERVRAIADKAMAKTIRIRGISLEGLQLSRTTLLVLRIVTLEDKLAKLDKERAAAVQDIRNWMRDRKADHAEQLASCEEKYEKLLASRKEEYERLLASLKQEYQRLLASRKEEYERLLASLKGEYEKCLASREEEHEKSMASREELYENLKNDYDALMDKYSALLRR